MISYNLAAGASSTPISLPGNAPLLVIATNTTAGDRGIGSMTVLHVPGQFLEWSGVNSTTGTNPVPTTTGGFSATPNQPMLIVDYGALVTIQVADADHFMVHNATNSTEAGSVWILNPLLS